MRGNRLLVFAGCIYGQYANSTPPSTVPALPKSKFDKEKAAKFAAAHAADSYKEAKLRGDGSTYCARAVRLAIEEGGIVLGRTALAKDYGPKLEAAGFSTVLPEGYIPQTGDVIVFQPPSTSTAGHMQIYDGEGKQWISDFKQKDPLWPNGSVTAVWKIEKPAYAIYRYAGD